MFVVMVYEGKLQRVVACVVRERGREVHLGFMAAGKTDARSSLRHLQCPDLPLYL